MSYWQEKADQRRILSYELRNLKREYPEWSNECELTVDNKDWWSNVTNPDFFDDIDIDDDGIDQADFDRAQAQKDAAWARQLGLIERHKPPIRRTWKTDLNRYDLKRLRFELGELVRRQRLALGRTQKELAAMIGMRASVISAIECCEHAPSITALARIAAALEIDLEVHFGDFKMGLGKKVRFRRREEREW